jgi:hypothetical protein
MTYPIKDIAKPLDERNLPLNQKNYNTALIRKMFLALNNHLEGIEESGTGIIIAVKLSYGLQFEDDKATVAK